MSNLSTMNLDDYMSMDYTLHVKPDLDYDYSLYFIAEYTELSGLVGTGNTQQQAIQDLEISKEVWFDTMIELGRPIPLPRADG